MVLKKRHLVRKKMRKKINWITFLIGCALLSAADNKPSATAGIDLNQIESNIQKLRKNVAEVENRKGISDVRLKRDPFATLIIPQKQKITEEEKKKERPSLTLYGIVSDGNRALAIINNEVKGEGEMMGEFKILKIKDEYVLLKYGDEIFPLYLYEKQKEMSK